MDGAAADIGAYESIPGSTPTLQSAVSSRVHPGSGSFGLPLSLIATNPTTEPRQGPTATVVFTFNKTITGATAAITEGTAVAGAPSFNGTDVTVDLTGVANQQYVTVALTGVTSADGGTGGGGSVRIGFLAGDVNGNRVVTLSDLLSVNNVLTQAVTSANFLRDVNVSGTLTLSDVLFVNGKLTQSLPAP